MAHPMYLLVFLLASIANVQSAVKHLDCSGADCYNKPDPEAADCLTTIDRLNNRVDKYKAEWEKYGEADPQQCLGCEVSQEECPADCPGIISNLIEFCTGVTVSAAVAVYLSRV